MRKNQISDNNSNRQNTRQSWDENDQYRRSPEDGRYYNQRRQDEEDYNEPRNYRNTGNEYNESMWREPQRGQGRSRDYNEWSNEAGGHYNDYEQNRIGGGRSYRNETTEYGQAYRNQDYCHSNERNHQQHPYESRNSQGNYSNEWNNGRYGAQDNNGRGMHQGYERNTGYGQPDYGHAQGHTGRNYTGNYGSDRYSSTGYAGQQYAGQQYAGGNEWGSGHSVQDYGQHRGKGPKGYQRSGERICEDISDRLSDDSMLDASDIEVKMEGSDVILSGSVDSRHAKRRAEDIAESVSGVSNVENRIKLKQSGREGLSGTTQATGSITTDKTGSAGANTETDKNKSKAS